MGAFLYSNIANLKINADNFVESKRWSHMFEQLKAYL